MIICIMIKKDPPNIKSIAHSLQKIKTLSAVIPRLMFLKIRS